MPNSMTLPNSSSFSSLYANASIQTENPSCGFVLPSPCQEVLSSSQQLVELICSQIQSKGGNISFADYMSLALYTKDLGYYSGCAEKFGLQGDFVTAPEISPLYSQCLANQCQEVLEKLDEGCILEIGAGTGQMAIDILIELKKNTTLPKRYYIFEISPILKKRQQDRLHREFANVHADLLTRIEWLDELPNSPFNGIILANEVLDALPVHLFTLKNRTIFERVVTEHDGKLEFKDLSSTSKEFVELCHSETLSGILNSADPISLGDELYCSEINLNLKNWIADLAQCLNHGILLLIDYGFPRHEYYHPDRSMGTLMCHYQHRCHGDPFLYPGLQDITAHIDFTTVAEAASDSNLAVLGFTNQANFLINAGLIKLVEREGCQVETFKKVSISNEVNLLTSQAEMGELFKVIALGKNFNEELLGFGCKDMRHRL